MKSTPPQNFSFLATVPMTMALNVAPAALPRQPQFRSSNDARQPPRRRVDALGERERERRHEEEERERKEVTPQKISLTEQKVVSERTTRCERLGGYTLKEHWRWGPPRREGEEGGEGGEREGRKSRGYRAKKAGELKGCSKCVQGHKEDRK